VYLRQRRFAEAAERMIRGQSIFQEATTEVAAGGDLAGVAAAHGRPDIAEQLATAMIADAYRTNDSWTVARALHTLADIRAHRGDIDASAHTYRKALNAWTNLRNPRRVALIEEAMAQLR
jgi:hypothetical protein